MRYTYRGDKLTDQALKGLQCDPVQRLNTWGKCAAGQGPVCIRGRNGSMLVVDGSGRKHVVLGRQLRVNR